MSVRLRSTVTVEYDANPADYGTEDPVEMAKIDQENWLNDPRMFYCSFEDDSFRVIVEPIV